MALANAANSNKNVTLTVATDDQTNSIIVNCSKTMYQDILKVTQELDRGAKETTRTVKIVPVHDVNPMMLQQVIDMMQGRSTAPTTTAPSPFLLPAVGNYNRGGIGMPGFNGGGYRVRRADRRPEQGHCARRGWGFANRATRTCPSVNTARHAGPAAREAPRTRTVGGRARSRRAHGGPDTLDDLELLHATCHRPVRSEGLVDESRRREDHSTKIRILATMGLWGQSAASRKRRSGTSWSLCRKRWLNSLTPISTRWISLRILRILALKPDKEWSGMPFAQQTQTQPQTTVAHLEALDKHGLITLSRDASLTCRYGPQAPKLESQVRELLRVYNERPVTMIRMVYARANSALKSFADAFRIRKED